MNSLMITFCWILFSSAAITESEPDSVEANFMVRNVSLFIEAEIPSVSIDRLSYMPYNPYTGHYGIAPQVILDGLPVDAEFFGIINPQYIPAASGTLESVEAYSGFGLYEGQPYFPGIISVKNSPLADGLSVFGSTQISNEAGEPGPWVYDPERVTPNVERFGPGMDLGVNYRNGDAYLRTLYRYHRHMNTDLAIQRRMRTMLAIPGGEYQQARAVNQTALAEAGFKNESVHLRARGVIAESDEFLFFQPLGREIPVNKGLVQATIAGEIYGAGSWELRSFIQGSRKYLGYFPNRFDHEFDLAQKNVTAQVSLLNNFEKGTTEAGVKFRTISYEGPGLPGTANHYADLFTKTNRNFGSSWHFAQHNNLTVSDRPVTIQISAELWKTVNKRWQAGINAGYFELNPDFTRITDRFTNRGYTLYDHLDLLFEIPGEIDPERFLSVGTNHRLTLSETLHAESDLILISHRAFHVPFQQVEYDERLNTLPGFYTLRDNLTGNRIELNAGITHSPVRNFSHRLHSVFSSTLSGDAAYRSYWNTVSRLMVSYTAEYQPFPDLELQMSVWYRSSTDWEEFDAIDGETFRNFNEHYPPTFGTFTRTTPSHLNINLKAAKWFWEQRLRTVVMMKNITNREYYSHPLGVREGFTFVLRAELRF